MWQHGSALLDGFILWRGAGESPAPCAGKRPQPTTAWQRIDWSKAGGPVSVSQAAVCMRGLACRPECKTVCAYIPFPERA